MDLNKITSELTDLLSSYLSNFISVLTNPRKTIKQFTQIDFEQFQNQPEHENNRLKKAFSYTLISIAIGVVLASFLELPKAPNTTNFGILIAVLFIWIFIAIFLHYLLKLFRGKGRIKETIVVFLFIVSTLHIIWIPVIALTSKLLTQTRVYLTYNYVISFSSAGWSRNKDIDVIKGIIPNYVESYIKGKSPEKENSILLPLDTTGTSPNRLVYDRRYSLKRERIIVDSSNLQLPKKSEVHELKEGAYGWISLISILYYLCNCVYLSIGLSIPHKISVTKLLFLSLAAPILITLTILILLFLRFFVLY